jgi:hypothetical protein
MKTAFISGPYKGKSKIWIINRIQRWKNIRAASKYAKYLWKQGFMPICPHLNSKNFDGICDDSRFLQWYIQLIETGVFDIMFMLPGWEKSPGSRDEHEVAKFGGKCRDIVYVSEDWDK